MAQTQYNSDKDYDLTVVGQLIVGGATTWQGDHTVSKATPVMEVHSTTDTIAEVVVDGGETTDSTVRFQNNNIDKWTVGNDGNATDAFVIAAGSALGTTNAISIANASQAVTFVGNVVLGASSDVSVTAGDSAVDFSGGTGLFKTTTGAVTVGSGAISVTGDVTLAAAKNLTFGAGSDVSVTAGDSAIDFSGGTGVFKTTTGAVTVGSGAVTLTGNTTMSKATPILEVDATDVDGTATIKIDGGSGNAAGDAVLVFEDFNSPKWSIGSDNSDADALVIASGGALGTTNRVRIASTGEVVVQTPDSGVGFTANGGVRLNNYVGIGTGVPTGDTLDIRNANCSVLIRSTTATNSAFLGISDGTNRTMVGTDSDAGGSIVLGSSANSTVLAAEQNNSIHFGTNNGVRLTISGAGVITIAANGNVDVAAGTSAIDFSGGSGVFKTTTGAVTIGPAAVAVSGDVTVSANKNITAAAGTGKLDWQLASGTFDSTTGENTLRGNVTIAGAKTFATGTGAITLNGSTTVVAGKTLTVTDDSGLLINGTAVAATAAELNRAADVSARLVNKADDGTLAVTLALHEGKIVTLDRALGITCTLPAATGTGGCYRFIVKTAAAGGSYIIKVADATDVMYGVALMAQDAGDTALIFEANAASAYDTVTLNGTTTGGLPGDVVELIDIATDTWWVRGTLYATGAEATPFSATV